MIVKIYIDNQRLDLFQDENITTQSSVLSSQDITKNTTDFSKSFTVPASDINNEIFKHYYNADIDNTFDARTKVKGSIELDGLPFKKGNFSLRKVIVKNNRASSYSIYFTGAGTDIKKELGNDLLKDLDLAAYNHNYNSDNVKLGLEDSLFSGDIVYNALVKKQLYYNSGTTVDGNIAYVNGAQTNGLIWSDLRPSIKLNRIIDAIQTDYGLTFSNDFFGRTEFDSLYMWLNPDTKNEIGVNSVRADFDGGSSDFVDFATDVGSFPAQNTSASNDKVTWTLYFAVIPEVGFENTPYKIKYFRQGELVTEQSFTGAQFITRELQFDGGSFTFDVYFEIETAQDFSFTKAFTQVRLNTLSGFPFTDTYTTTGSVQTILSTINVSFNIPKLKVIDFLRGIFKMFKLVVIPIRENEFYINDLDSYYASGKLIDVTQYIDFEKVEIERGEILNEIKYNFEEPETILNAQFKLNTSLAYGDEELLLEDADGEPLEGESLEVEVPFEQIVYERLNDINDNAITNFMYGAIIDEDLEPANPKAHIFYNVNTEVGGKSIAFVEDDGNVVSINNINTASHSIDFLTKPFSTIFSSEFSNWDFDLISNTLYTNYHSDYISSLFNIKRRDFSFKSILPVNILTTIQLNDVLKIRENYYRIDNYTLGLTDGKSKLNLINSFDNSLVGFANTQTSVITDARAHQQVINIKGSEEFTVNKIDQGQGVSWATITKDNRLLTIDLDSNLTATDRGLVIELTTATTGTVLNIFLTQKRSKIITADNSVITVDTTLITADNG